jgi:hypothetical protein
MSNISFTDNTFNRKSLQGYILKLFRGPDIWRVNKQDIVMMSSTEVKLLALSQIVKELIFILYVLKILSLELDKLLAIEYDNHQTIQLLAKSAKLQMKLRHINIYLY